MMHAVQKKGLTVAKFLMMTDAAVGHVMPCLPIMRKLIERGHEVVWMTGRRYRDKVEELGARFQPLPDEMDPGDLDMYEARFGDKELKGLAQIKWAIKHVYLDSCVAVIESIDRILADFPADALVGDSVAFGVNFRSEMDNTYSRGACISLLPLSLPSRDTAPWGLGLLPGKNIITRTRNRLLNFLIDHVVLRDVTTYANNVRRELGLGPLVGPLFSSMWKRPSLIIHLSTPAFEYPRSDQLESVHFVGPILPEPNQEFHPPSWWNDLKGSEPVVLVNQGTISIILEDLIVPTIRALKDQQMLVVAVPVKESQLGELPANVRAEPFVPFDHLLPHVDVMVTNGGYGATQMALAHGIPLVVAGETEDKMEVAARVEWSGAGINLRKHRPTPAAIREAVKEVLVNPTYRTNAERIQADFAKYDAPTRAAELLEALVRGELDSKI